MLKSSFPVIGQVLARKQNATLLRNVAFVTQTKTYTYSESLSSVTLTSSAVLGA